jgi:transcriptional regulator of arginine metabolism
MTDARTRRQRALSSLLRSQTLASQEELARGLEALGFAATQATVSRDLDHLGAVRIRRGGHISYALPEAGRAPDWAARRLGTLLAEWARSIDPAGNLVVIKTPPGSAHLVGVALDQAERTEIVGTICGDDTLFIAVRSAAEAQTLAEQLLELASGEGPQATV